MLECFLDSHFIESKLPVIKGFKVPWDFSYNLYDNRSLHFLNHQYLLRVLKRSGAICCWQHPYLNLFGAVVVWLQHHYKQGWVYSKQSNIYYPVCQLQQWTCSERKTVNCFSFIHASCSSILACVFSSHGCSAQYLKAKLAIKNECFVKEHSKALKPLWMYFLA